MVHNVEYWWQPFSEFNYTEEGDYIVAFDDAYYQEVNYCPKKAEFTIIGDNDNVFYYKNEIQFFCKIPNNCYPSFNDLKLI